MFKLSTLGSVFAGFLFGLICFASQVAGVYNRTGVALGCASGLLLGFVSCAVLTSRWLGWTAPPRSTLTIVLLHIPLKAACFWFLCFGLIRLTAVKFGIALAATLAHAYYLFHSGTNLPLFGLLVATLCALSQTTAAPRSLYAGLASVLIGGSLAPLVTVAQPSSWSSLDGYCSVFLLVAAGIIENNVPALSSQTLPRAFFSVRPAVYLAICGAIAYIVFAKCATSTRILPFAASAAVSCFLFSATYSTSLIFTPVACVCLVASAVFAAAAILLCRKLTKFRDAEKSTKMTPSLLFAQHGDDSSKREIFRVLLSNPRERKLVIFLLLTVAIMVLEFLYGFAVNSLGLISDSFHMMLDGASIAIGLCAAYAASWKPSEKSHPFGYSRYEVLGGFINGVLLLFIAFYVMLESIERIIDPPKIEAAYLLLVSVIGLVVNIIGVVFFHDSHGHSHSHGHGGGGGGGRVDHNMRGVYLHILADLLGSVSVIISSIFIYLFNFWIADPICSVLSATLILISAFPLLEETGKVLLLAGPETESNFAEALRKELLTVGLLSDIEVPRLWMHSTAPRELMLCVISGKLKRDVVYTEAREALLKTAEHKIAHDLSVDNVNIIVNLE